MFTSSNDTEVNHKGLSSIHEGAAINYFQLGDDAEVLEYDEEKGIIYKEIDIGGVGYNWTVSVSDVNSGFPYLELGPNEGAGDEWQVTQWGTDRFLFSENPDLFGPFSVAKNTSDPYRVSERAYLVGLGDPESFKDSVSDLKEVNIVIESV